MEQARLVVILGLVSRPRWLVRAMAIAMKLLTLGIGLFLGILTRISMLAPLWLAIWRALALPPLSPLATTILMLWFLNAVRPLLATRLRNVIRWLNWLRIMLCGTRLTVVVGALGCGEQTNANVEEKCVRCIMLTARRKLLLALLGNLMTTLAETRVLGTVLWTWFKTLRNPVDSQEWCTVCRT